jgi:hypothetical protein
MVEGLPVFIGQTETSGRGLYATRPMLFGEVVHRATPLVGDSLNMRPEPKTLNPAPETVNHKPYCLNPEILNPTP